MSDNNVEMEMLLELHELVCLFLIGYHSPTAEQFLKELDYVINKIDNGEELL